MNNILKVIKKGDYRYALIPDHPKATKNGYVLLHRALMENKLGRYLTDDEVVHHKDHNRLNNSIENLELMDKQEHLLLHGKEHHEKKQYVDFVCPVCGKPFKKAKNLVAKSYKYGPFCSRSCSAKNSRLHGWTGKVKATVA